MTHGTLHDVLDEYYAPIKVPDINREGLQSAILDDLLASLPADLKYDVVVALREGSYIRGQDYKVEGYNQALEDVRTALTKYVKGDE